MEAAKTQLATQPDNTAITMGFGSLQSFEFMQRTAKMFAQSSMVPTAYRAINEKGYGNNLTYVDNPAAVPNCIIALNMSMRMNADPLMIMQNLHIIEGRPSWSSQFIIAAINTCGRFSPLRYDLVKGDKVEATHTTFEWENNKKVPKTSTITVPDIKCIAWSVERGVVIPNFSFEELKKHDGSLYQCCKTHGVPMLESPPVSIKMAAEEGWYSKNGSKWRTMPEVMLRYRSAAFFGRLYAPELLMGLPTEEEVRDTIDVELQKDGTYAMPEQPKTDPKPPQSKSEKAKQQAEAKATPEAKATDVDFKEQPEVPATSTAETTATPAATTAATEPATSDGAPLTDTERNYLQFKLEEAALSSNDVFKKFGIRLEEVTHAHFKDVVAWIKNPD